MAEAVHLYASPKLQPEIFRSDLQSLMQRLEFNLIIPVCEEVFHLAEAAVLLGCERRLFAPTQQILNDLHSKCRFVEVCEQLGISAPKTRRINGQAELDQCVPEAERLVFKPEYSRFGVEALISPSTSQLARISPAEHRVWVAQDRIVGEEVCFHAVAVNGVLTAFAAYRSSWRRPGGVGYAFEPLDEAVAAFLLDVAHRLAGFAGDGQFACDVIIDADGRPWLIECNPRGTSGVHMFGGRQELAMTITGKAGGLVCGRERGHLGLAMWLYGLPDALRQDRLDSWLRLRRQGQDVIARGGSPTTVLGALIDSAAFSVRAARSGCSLEQAMTRDIEWNGPGGAL
nr:ATP-grasp domain-containing protein [uncultured Brevundimonas sp.]